MKRFSLSQLSTRNWSFEQDLENYRNAGIRAIGVWRHKLSDVEIGEAADLLGDSGLGVSSLSWAGGFYR